MYMVVAKGKGVVGIFRLKKNARRFGKKLDCSWRIERRHWHSTEAFASWLKKKIERHIQRKYNRLTRKGRIIKIKIKKFEEKYDLS